MDTGMDMIRKKSLLNVNDEGAGAGGGGSEVLLCHDRSYLIPPVRLHSILITPPPHWQSISYSTPFKLCWP